MSDIEWVKNAVDAIDLVNAGVARGTVQTVRVIGVSERANLARVELQARGYTPVVVEPQSEDPPPQVDAFLNCD